MIAHSPFAEDNAGKQSHKEPNVAHDPVTCLLSWRWAGLASDDFLKEPISVALRILPLLVLFHRFQSQVWLFLPFYSLSALLPVVSRAFKCVVNLLI